MCIRDRSYDEGRSWPDIRDIELAPEPPPALNLDKPDRRARELSYPTVTADAEGRINVAYSWLRRALKFVRFRPAWVKGAQSFSLSRFRTGKVSQLFLETL